MDGRITNERIRANHALYHKTRCAAWLLATGNRPVGGVTEVTLFKTPVAVRKVADPVPEFECDIHGADE